MRKFYTKFPGAKLTEPLWGAVAGVQEGQVLISRVSRHSVRSLGKLQQTEQRGYHPRMQRIWHLGCILPKVPAISLRTGAAHGARAAPPDHGGD